MQFKTNWTASDYLTYLEFNRIVNNQLTIFEILKAEFYQFNGTCSPMTITNGAMAYADYFNVIENNHYNLLKMANKAFGVSTSSLVKWDDNGYTPTYNDVNRWERALTMINEHIEKARKGYIYSGESYVGGDINGAI